MNIKLSRREAEEYLYRALCNIGDTFAFYGLKINWDNAHYSHSRKHLPVGPCIEDVLMQMLRDGYPLIVSDVEGNEYNRSITLKDVHERLEKTPAQHLIDMHLGQDDASTADAILQTVFFNEIIFA